MDDLKTDQAVQNVVDETTQVNSPTTEAPATQGQTTKGEANPESVSNELPNDTEEQRKAFQEMRLELKQLKEEKAARSKGESAFKVFRPQVSNVYPAELRVEDYTDPMTGEINRPAYNAATEAVKARQAANMAQQSVTDQLDENTARLRHPDLFADSEAEEEVAARWLFAKQQGKNVTISDIADSVARKYGKAVSKAEKVGMERALEQVTPKEQAALSATAQNSSPAKARSSEEDYLRLIDASRRGGSESMDAITARMKGVSWVNK
jgi:hypothetical protein